MERLVSPGRNVIEKLVSILILILAILLMFVGCSSSRSNPVAPEKPTDSLNLPVESMEVIPPNHSLQGIWSISFDTQKLAATITPERILERHYNATSLIPPPQVTVNSYDPATNVIDVDVTLENPFNLDVYDVRGIIFIDSVLHYLLNPDDWTPLYDIPGGYDVNPFRAFAKSVPNRKFAAHSEQTENFQIYLPQGNRNVLYAVDASYPVNCEEPNAFANFTQENIYENTGSNALVSIDVFDWQNNVNSVNINSPEITGQPLVPFQQAGGNRWRLNLVNNTGARYGEYDSWIIAKSSNSGTLALYHRVSIVVSPGIDSEPRHPRPAGSIYYYYSCEDVFIDGDYAYVADSYNGLKILDISNPSEPICLSVLFPNVYISFARTVCVRGDYAYVAIIDDGFAIIDVSNKRNPRLLSVLPIDGFGLEITISGDYAYLSAGSEGVKIIDISDPYNPELISSIPSTDRAYGVTIDGNYAYIAENLGDLKVYDVSDPRSPRSAGYELTPGWVKDVEISGDKAYLADTYEGLSIVDISDPTHPHLIKNLNISREVLRIKISGDYAFLADWHGLTVVNISNPLNPVVVGELDNGLISLNISLSENIVILAHAYDGMSIVDVSDPTEPRILSSIGKQRWATDFDISGNIVAQSYGDLQLTDVSDSMNPEIISTLELEGAESVDIDGSYAYIFAECWIDQYTYYSYFQIVDISDPSFPDAVYANYLGMEPTNWGATLKAHGDYLYLCGDYGNSDKLKIYDIHDPRHPQVLTPFDLPADYKCGPEFKGDFLYIGLDPNDVYVLDNSDPAHPEIVTSFNVGHGQLEKILFDNDYMITMMTPDYVNVYDVTDPSAPEFKSVIQTGGAISDASISGNFIYILDEEQGLAVYDIRNPSNPTLFSTLIIPKRNYNIAVQDNHAYITRGEKGFFVIDLW